MTPHFITPCYVRVEDADKRKEICEQLEKIGYGLGRAYADALDTVIVTYPMVANTFCTGSNGQFDETDLKGCIDCGTNIELFLALASMRSGTDKEQWFVCEESYADPMLDYRLIEVGMLVKQGEFDQYAKAFYRKATVIEIINYHKQKGA